MKATVLLRHVETNVVTVTTASCHERCISNPLPLPCRSFQSRSRDVAKWQSIIAHADLSTSLSATMTISLYKYGILLK